MRTSNGKRRNTKVNRKLHTETRRDASRRHYSINSTSKEDENEDRRKKNWRAVLETIVY